MIGRAVGSRVVEILDLYVVVVTRVLESQRLIGIDIPDLGASSVMAAPDAFCEHVVERSSEATVDVGERVRVEFFDDLLPAVRLELKHRILSTVCVEVSG